MREILLTWSGPFSLRTSADRAKFDPPRESGLYLWCIGEPPALKVSYVGEGSNLRTRMYQHIHSTLGGAYCLYSRNHLNDDVVNDPAYVPGIENIIGRFVEDYESYSKMAYDNLMAYTFYWATLDYDRQFRRMIESALIDACRKSTQPLQNVKSSIHSANCDELTVVSQFEGGTCPAAFLSAIAYGTRQECRSEGIASPEA